MLNATYFEVAHRIYEKKKIKGEKKIRRRVKHSFIVNITTILTYCFVNC